MQPMECAMGAEGINTVQEQGAEGGASYWGTCRIKGVDTLDCQSAY